MEKRIGTVTILIISKTNVNLLNSILSEFSEIIIGRLGLPLKEKRVSVIALIVEGTTDQIGAMTGKIGKLDGIQVKSVLTKFREEQNGGIEYC